MRIESMSIGGREQFEVSREELGIASIEDTPGLQMGTEEPKIERLIESNKELESEKKSEFKKNKAAASEFLEKETRGEEVGDRLERHSGKLDDNVRELVLALNDLPFLYTADSCGGHIIDRESLLRKYGGCAGPRVFKPPPEGYALYICGGVGFEIDGSPRSLEFVEKLSEVVSRFEGARFHRPRPDQSYLHGSIELSENTARRKIDIGLAKELEAKRETLKSEIIRLAEEFLQQLT